MDNYQIAYLITLAVQIGVSVVVLARQGYFYKKGQNKADKEDIEGLTKVVESIKAEFSRENAKINSDLDILKDRKGKTYTQAQQAIINYYTDFNNLYFYIVKYRYPLQLEIDADNITNMVQELKFKEDVSFNLMTLLVDSEKTIQVAREMHK